MVIFHKLMRRILTSPPDIHTSSKTKFEAKPVIFVKLAQNVELTVFFWNCSIKLCMKISLNTPVQPVIVWAELENLSFRIIL